MVKTLIHSQDPFLKDLEKHVRSSKQAYARYKELSQMGTIPVEILEDQWACYEEIFLRLQTKIWNACRQLETHKSDLTEDEIRNLLESWIAQRMIDEEV